jgi:hypothetical protein
VIGTLGTKRKNIKYNILLATESPDDVIDKGEINKENAIKYFLQFPFKKELEKRVLNQDLMAPTITFHDDKSNLDLAIWSEEHGK